MAQTNCFEDHVKRSSLLLILRKKGKVKGKVSLNNFDCQHSIKFR